MSRIPWVCRAILVAVLLLWLVPGFASARPVEPDRLQWHGCADTGLLRCARLSVPVDYRDPDGAHVSIALAEAPARNPKARLGTLVVNRGGPGYPSTQYLAALVAGTLPTPWDERVWDRYDVVAVDARGVGQSQPQVRCVASPADEARLAAGVSEVPVGPDQTRRRALADAEFASGCGRFSGVSLSQLSTATAARDLDAVRRALGAKTLNYLGQSYGASLGMTYLNIFGAHAGRFAFDSVESPTWMSDTSDTVYSERANTDVATQQVMNEFLRLCATGRTCAFGPDNPSVAYPRLLARLRTGPLELPVLGGPALTLDYAGLVSLLGGALYQSSDWPVLAVLLNEAYGVATGAWSPPLLPSVAAFAREMGASLGDPYGDIWPIFDGYTCNDGTQPRSAAAWQRAASRREPLAPGFATERAYESSSCAFWPAHAAERYAGPWRTRTPVPVLLLNDRYDPATPLAGAEQVAGLLPGSRLLIIDGWGHVTTQQSTCAAAALSDYLATGRLPAPGLTCRPTTVPFS